MYSTTRRFAALAAVLLTLGACQSSDPYKGMSDQQLYALATQQYKKGDYNHAIRVLNYLTLNFGNSKLLPDAQMLLAKSDVGNKEYLTANADFQTFLQRYPGDARAPDAALGRCQALAAMSPIAERDQTYTHEAIGACANVVSDYAGTAQAQQASQVVSKMRDKLAHKEYLDAEFYLRRHLTDSAIKYFGFVVDDYPHSDWAPKALLEVYKANKVIGYDDLANEAKERLINSYPDSQEAKSLSANGSKG
jgi:outer membrane assembly lipoprotein YfiO